MKHRLVEIHFTLITTAPFSHKTISIEILKKNIVYDTQIPYFFKITLYGYPNHCYPNKHFKIAVRFDYFNSVHLEENSFRNITLRLI